MKINTITLFLFISTLMILLLSGCSAKSGTVENLSDAEFQKVSDGWRAEYYRGFYESCMYVPVDVDIPGDTVRMHTPELCKAMTDAAKRNHEYEKRLTAGRLPAREQILGTPSPSPEGKQEDPQG